MEDTGQAASVRCPSCSHDIPLTGSASNGLNEDAGFASRARRLLTEAIQIECDSCSLCLKVPKKMASRRIRCPGCGFMINVPAEILDPEAFEEVKPANAQEAALAAISKAVASPAGQAAKSAPRTVHKKRSMGVMPWILLLIAAGLVGGIVYGLNALQNRPKTDSSKKLNAAENSISATQPATAANAKASLKIISCNWQTFANPAGYFPAAPGRRYACVELEVSAGRSGLEFPFDDSAAFLESGTNRYYAIGTEINAASFIPADVDRKPVKIDPSSTATVRLIFNLPAAEIRGRLEIKGCNELLVSMPALPLPSVELQGEYYERPPRNLKPMQRDPIMREFQLHSRLTFVSSRISEKVFSIKFPQVQVSGTAELQPDGTFNMTLEHTLHGKLSCRATLTEDGKTLIVFLSDKPMHQLTFQKQPAN